MRPSQIFGVFTCACIVAAPLPATAAPPLQPGKPVPADTSPAGEDREARRLYDARMYPAAAEAFESLHATSRVPKHLFNAAMSRELAGHEGHAYLLLRRYLDLPDLQPNERARAQDRVLALQRRTVAVRIAVAPAEAQGKGLEISIRRAPSGSPIDVGRAPIELAGEVLSLLAVPGRSGEFELLLEKGPWELTAKALGFLDVRQDISVTTGQAQVTLALAPEPPPATPVTASFAPPEAVARGVDLTLTREGEAPRAEQVRQPALTWALPEGAYRLSARARGFLPLDASFTVARDPVALEVRLAPEPVVVPPPPPRRDPWALGLAIGGGIAAAGGVGLLVLGRVQYGRTLDRYAALVGDDPEMWFTASQNLIRSWMTYGAGAGLVGAGVGLGLGALGLHVEPRLRRPRILWGVAGGLGAVFALGGGLLVGRAGYRLQTTLEAHSDRFFALDGSAANAHIGAQHRVAASAALLGFGAGLALSSMLALVRKPRTRTTLIPTGTGVVWSGHF